MTDVHRTTSGAWQFLCTHGERVNATLRADGWHAYAYCRKCPPEALQPVLDAIERGLPISSPQDEGAKQEVRQEKAPPGQDGAGHAGRDGGQRAKDEPDDSYSAGRNGNAQVANDDFLRRMPPNSEDAEKAVLGAIFLEDEAIGRIPWLTVEMFYREVHREIYKAMLTLRSSAKPIDIVTMRAVLERAGKWGFVSPQYLAEILVFVPGSSNIEHYAAIVRDMSIKRQVAERAAELVSLAYNGVTADALIGELQSIASRTSEVATIQDIGWEGFDDAVLANDEYLKRTPVIDKLCYSHAVSLITGGKHAGKSTLARWMAVCVAKGWPVLGREVTQGPVFYIASEDETMAARQELIRLGWRKDDPLRFFPATNVDDPDKFLGRLADEIRRYRVIFVVLDMLFDFVRIADEMSYAGTRAALGKIQNVASLSGAHMLPIHHAPKNAQIGDATVAALGSQGLAARVSPIILVRRFGPGVHSISSTGVRDPRGQALVESRLLRNEDGSVVLGGAFKNYMLAEVYAERVMDILDGEDGSEYTATDMAQALDISYQIASKCLSLLYKQGLVGRRGDGKKRRPFVYSKIISGANDLGESGNMAVNDTAINMNPDDDRNSGRFGYKD